MESAGPEESGRFPGVSPRKGDDISCPLEFIQRINSEDLVPGIYYK